MIEVILRYELIRKTLRTIITLIVKLISNFSWPGGIIKISARNMVKGKVKQVITGSVNDEVIIELAGGVEVVSIITRESAEKPGITPAKEVYAIVKASDVMIGAG